MIRPTVHVELYCSNLYSMFTTSPPCAVPNAFQATKSMLFEMKPTLPSHLAVLIPPVCRLRAPIILGRVTVLAVTHGINGAVRGTQLPPVMTSGSVLLGGRYVTNAVPFPHQLKPRKSFRLPCKTSEANRVLLVPSDISPSLTGRP